MNKFKKALFVIVPIFILSLILYKAFPQISPTAGEAKEKKNETKTVLVSNDFPSSSELSDMIDNSDLIVVGTYESLESKWNMARDPEDFTKESTTDYVEGHLYNFKVNEVLKGESEENIKINHRYAQTLKLEETSGDEVISPEGILIEEPTEKVIHEVESVDPLFIKPELNEKYIVFLKKGEDTGNYFGAIEPSSILFDENNIATVQSNLINLDDENLTQTEVIGDQTFKITNDIHTEITDTLSGKDFNTIKQEIKTITE